MKDLSVLTPPFLMAAVVIIAIVAFLRHEMGRRRVDRPDPDDIPAPGPDLARTAGKIARAEGDRDGCGGRGGES